MAAVSNTCAEEKRRAFRAKLAAAIARYTQFRTDEDRADYDRALQAFGNFLARQKTEGKPRSKPLTK